MEISGRRSIILSSGLLACSVFLFVVALAYFDSQAAEILKEDPSSKWIGLICAIPLFIGAAFIYSIFIRKHSPSRRLILSVIFGIPVSLLGIVSVLSYLNQ